MIIKNSSKCENCTNCTIKLIHNLEHIYCNERDKTWLFGQVIAPCHNYKKRGK